MISLESIENINVDDIVEILRYHKIRSVEINTSKTGLDQGDSFEATMTEWYGAKTEMINIETAPKRSPHDEGLIA